MSLGGVRDEARFAAIVVPISVPCGTVIQNTKAAGSKNPVFLLDEVDKLGGSDYKGDPSSALLEVLIRNKTIPSVIIILNLPLTCLKSCLLQQPMFPNIPRPLLDRMEVVEISGYTEDEN